MKIKEIYPDVITEDTSYEYKAVLNPDNPIKWAKTLIGYANDKGGTLFIWFIGIFCFTYHPALWAPTPSGSPVIGGEQPPTEEGN